MADKSQPLILEALSRAAAQPAGLPLHGSKTAPGLFASTAAAKQLARRCKDEGLLRVVRTETRGKTVQEICAISEQGLAFLLNEASPKRVLENLVREIEARKPQLADLLVAAKEIETNFEGLKGVVEKVLLSIQQAPSTNGVPSTNGKASPAASESWIEDIIAHLRTWRGSAGLEDCPLPELYRAAQVSTPGLTIGQFHDGLRRLHAHHQIYLHPWSGPLYELPEPALALLIGHVVAYYASLR
jgi:hypothetical protein